LDPIRIKRALVATVLGCLGGVGAHLGLNLFGDAPFTPRHTMGMRLRITKPNPENGTRQPDQSHLLGKAVLVGRRDRRWWFHLCHPSSIILAQAQSHLSF